LYYYIEKNSTNFTLIVILLCASFLNHNIKAIRKLKKIENIEPKWRWYVKRTMWLMMVTIFLLTHHMLENAKEGIERQIMQN
jgi:hypothetical protein